MSEMADENTRSMPALLVPDERCRRWLLIGIVALLIDLVMGIAATVLEFQHRGEEGFTSDVIMICVAIIPQMFVVAAYLVLARTAGSRSLWKSSAGMLGSYLLLCLLGLGLLDVLGEDGDTSVIVLVGIGILALLGFCISGIPHFTEPIRSDIPEEESSSSEGPGWIGGLGIILVFLVVRVLYRRFVRPLIRVGLDVDDWQLIELLALILLGASFAVWFAVTKIRHRQTLGTLASVAGWTELLILLIHAGMAITILSVLMNEAELNPLLDDAGIDRLLDPWTRRASLISAACHAVWTVLTGCFFTSVRRRSQGTGNEP